MQLPWASNLIESFSSKGRVLISVNVFTNVVDEVCIVFFFFFFLRLPFMLVCIVECSL